MRWRTATTLMYLVISDPTPQKLTGGRDSLHHLRAGGPALLRHL